VSALLEVEDLNAWYGPSHVLQGVSFAVAEGTVTSLLGRNGAGKTTLLKSIMGLIARRRGRVVLGGRRLDHRPAHARARAGLAYVPETRGIFASLSVLENLTVAARKARGAPARGWTLEAVLELFPFLAERAHTGGGALSGGEQQMLAIARALLGNGRVLLLDEPTEGLAPAVVREIEQLLGRLKRQGLTILLVEQNLAVATRLADRVLVLGKGRLRWQGEQAEFAAAEEVRRTWLGV
jgi:branched-chain amino acid transport system ATP-binding protein